MVQSVHRSVFAPTAALVLILILGLAAPSRADPGSPGLTKATSAVYVAEEDEFGATQLGHLGDANTPTRAARQAVGDATGLPFTGLAAPAMLVAGLIALAIGLTARRIARAY